MVGLNNNYVPQKTQKHEDPTNYGFWNPSCLGPNVGKAEDPRNSLWAISIGPYLL